MSDEAPVKPPARPLVIVIEVDRRISIEEVTQALVEMTPYFQKVTCWGSTNTFLTDKENEYLINKDDPFVGCQPTGSYH